MTLEENKAIVRRQFDLVERRDLGALDEVMAADGANHALGRIVVGLEPFQAILGAIHSVFLDEMTTIVDMIAEGDKVVVRATLKGKHQGSGIPLLAGIKPEGRPVEWQFIHIFRLRDGKIVEHWAQRNDLEVIQQF
jgi:predicted ester cyclase